MVQKGKTSEQSEGAEDLPVLSATIRLTAPWPGGFLADVGKMWGNFYIKEADPKGSVSCVL